MPSLDTYKKQAKLLLRQHREGNYSVGGRIRQLTRYGSLTDSEVLGLRFQLVEAQELIALEAGHASWADLKVAVAEGLGSATELAPPGAAVGNARPVLFVTDVAASAAFYRDSLGFSIDFLHGLPPFYGSVSRGDATLHMRQVDSLPYLSGALEQERLIVAYIEVENVKDLYLEYQDAGVEIVQRLTQEAWGGTDFVIHDPDGNRVCFSAMRRSKG